VKFLGVQKRVTTADDYFQIFTQKSESAQGAAADQSLLPPWYLSLMAKKRWRYGDDQR
jgi:hypothetical protein